MIPLYSFNNLSPVKLDIDNNFFKVLKKEFQFYFLLIKLVRKIKKFILHDIV